MGGEGRREQNIARYFHVVKYLCIYSMCWAQSMDLGNPRIALRKTWIRSLRDNRWICAYLRRKVQLRGQSMDCAAQTTDCLVHSQVQSKVLQVSGVALAS